MQKGREILSCPCPCFQEFLERDNSVTIHERKIQVPLTEIFKVKSRIAKEIMAEIFKFKDQSYDLRKNN